MKKQKDDLAALMNASLETANHTIRKKAPAPKPAICAKPAAKTRRSTIAFHSDDLVRIDAVLDFLRDGSGARGTLSDGVKIALALCPLNSKKLRLPFAISKNKTDGENDKSA